MDNPTRIEQESSVEDFKTSWSAYNKAKSYVAKYGNRVESAIVKEFSIFSKVMENEIKNILKDTFQEFKTKGDLMNIAKKVALENKSFDRLDFKLYLKQMQEAYIRRVAQVFMLKPEDLDTTCKVLATCQFLKVS